MMRRRAVIAAVGLACSSCATIPSTRTAPFVGCYRLVGDTVQIASYDETGELRSRRLFHVIELRASTARGQFGVSSARWDVYVPGLGTSARADRVLSRSRWTHHGADSIRVYLPERILTLAVAGDSLPGRKQFTPHVDIDDGRRPDVPVALVRSPCRGGAATTAPGP